MRTLLTLLMAGSLFSASLTAKVRIGAPFGDGMVLQGKSKVSLWGKAKAASVVTILPSWNYKETKVKTDADGNWKTALPTPTASYTPYSITIKDGESTVLVRNVLIGEVWIASGQSNMEMPVKGWKDCPVANSAKTISEANKYSGKLHFMNIPMLSSAEPQDTVCATWKDCTTETVGDCSAAAYHFACTLSDNLKVPIGIINCSYGGSNVEAWIPKDILSSYGIDVSEKAFKKLNMHTPSGLYNAMLHPLIGYTIKGFIWYQGEANVSYLKDDYVRHFSDMIKCWRKEWKQGTLPFYFVEIAPYKYDLPERKRAAVIRAYQNEVAHTLAKTGMVPTNDLVTKNEESQIHPANKHDVGKRLANWALANDYKKANINYKNPEYKSMSIKNGRAYIAFKNTSNGFNRQDGITGFEICGTDKVFRPATVVVKDTKVMVYSPKVDNPIAVRYCFKDFQLGNLANKEGLPIIAFRTDNFPLR